MDVPPDGVIALGVALILKSKRKSKTKRKWAKGWLLDKNTYPNIKLIKELAANEPEDFKNYLRMDER
jgi:hypothetical protein